MVSLTFYGGANEIGGNKILLEDKGVRIYLDFGQPFDFGEEYFYDFLSPRTANGLEVFFEFGLLPKLSGLYSKQQLMRTDVKHAKPDVDAVFITHGHSDHVGHLSFLDESIPIYIGHGAHKIIEMYHEFYPSLIDIGEHHNLHRFKSGDKIKVGHLEVEPVHVDHSIPGAYGFLVHTSQGVIAYTGDFRMHGPRADMTGEFMEKAAESKPYALICEGTRMGSESEHNYSEGEVEKKASEITAASKGLVLAYFSMSNVDRFMCFYSVAKKNRRTLVIDPRLAHIIHNLREKIPSLPDVMKDPHIAVYYRLAKSCTFSPMDYYIWERPYMGNMITYREVAKDPQRYLMHMGFYRLMELVYLQPKDADFIYSMSEHFYEGDDNEEMRAIWENWMRHFKIKFHKLHSSGHASAKDIADFIKAVSPKLVIPVHTQNAQDFRKIHPHVRLPQKGETLEL